MNYHPYLAAAAGMLVLVAGLFLTGELTVPPYLAPGGAVMFLLEIGGGLWLLGTAVAWLAIALLSALRTVVRS